MGLFSSKPKKPKIDMVKCEANKKRLREIFNQVVEDGDSYKIIYAWAADSQYSSGILLDTRTTTYSNFVVGHRETDYKVVVIEIDMAMEQFGEPLYITMDEVIGTDYYRKIYQAWFIYAKNKGSYGVKLVISDNLAGSPYTVPNLEQSEEREQFLDFLERYSDKLREKGFKVIRWKR